MSSPVTFNGRIVGHAVSDTQLDDYANHRLIIGWHGYSTEDARSPSESPEPDSAEDMKTSGSLTDKTDVAYFDTDINGAIIEVSWEERQVRMVWALLNLVTVDRTTMPPTITHVGTPEGSRLNCHEVCRIVCVATRSKMYAEEFENLMKLFGEIAWSRAIANINMCWTQKFKERETPHWIMKVKRALRGYVAWGSPDGWDIIDGGDAETEDPDFSVLPPHVLRTLCEAASDDEAVVDDGVAFDGGAASSKVHNWLEGTHLPPDSGFVSRQSPVDEGYQADNEGDKINAA